ncbi:MAG: hypothetical protein K2J87_08900, partial [Muribaculaceae bacterium]|nr:hypothetical protein [Muribaculaceae bacterium]
KADYHVSFEFEGAGADSYIESVTVDDEDIPDFKNGFDVPDGKMVQMKIASKNTDIKVLVNGEEPTYVSFLRTYSFSVTQDTIVKVVASQLAESPISITVYVNDYQGVEFGYLSDPPYAFMDPINIPLELKNDGANQVTMPDTKVNQVYVKAREGYTLKSVKANGTEVANPEKITITEGMTLAIEVEANTKFSYTIKLEYFSHIVVNNGSEDIQLTSSEETFTFLSGTEVRLAISAAEGYEITAVKLDGEPKEGTSQYNVTVTNDGSVIEIEAKKLATYHVAFEFEGEGADSYITSVTANYKAIPDFKDGFDATENASVVMNVGSKNEDLKVSYNGVELTYSGYFGSGSYSFTLTENTVVKVVASTPMTINVDVDNVKAVEFGYISPASGWMPSQQHPLTLEKDNVNEVTMPNTTITQVYVKANEGYNLKSVKADGTEVANPADITITDGMTLVIETEEKAKLSYTVKCDDYSHVVVSDGSADLELTSNDQTFTFPEGSEVNLTIKPAEGYVITSVKLDGTPVEGGPDYSVEVTADGSVIEIESEAVKMFTVKFEFDNPACEDYIQGVDVGTETLIDFKEGFEAPEGTNITLKRSEELDPNFEVSVNGEVVTFDKMFRNYSFILKENTVVKVSNPNAETFTVDVNNAAIVEVGWIEEAQLPGMPGTKHKFELNDDENELPLPSGCKEIYVTTNPATNSVIKSVKVNGVAVDSENYNAIPVSNGDKITIEADNASSLVSLTATDREIKVYDLSGNQVIVKDGMKGLAKGIY